MLLQGATIESVQFERKMKKKSKGKTFISFHGEKCFTLHQMKLVEKYL